jgi:hypothetical protein
MEQKYLLDSPARGLLHNVMNEVLRGFKIANFDSVIGTSPEEFQQLMKKFDPSKDSLALDAVQVLIFRNAIRERPYSNSVWKNFIRERAMTSNMDKVS